MNRFAPASIAVAAMLALAAPVAAADEAGDDPEQFPTPPPTVEPSADADQGGSLEGPGPAPEPQGAPPAGTAKGPQLTIDTRALLGSGRGGYVNVYVANGGDADAKGTIAIVRGNKTLWRQDAEVDWDDTETWGNFRLSAGQRRTLLRRGRLGGLKSVATWTGADGRTVTATRPLTILRGGASGYDGTYRGQGPVVIKVQRGVIRAITTPLNLFCTRSKRFQQRVFLGDGGGFPVLVGRDGRFQRKGRFASDIVTYNGRFTRGGRASGYLSMFHTELSSVDGKLSAEQCLQAKNWKASR